MGMVIHEGRQIEESQKTESRLHPSPYRGRTQELTQEKILMLGRIEGRRRMGQYRMRWYHRLYGHELEQTPGVGDGQGGLACCSPWGHRESDMTERLN